MPPKEGAHDFVPPVSGKGAATQAGSTGRRAEWVVPRAFGAIGLALPTLLLATLLVWIGLDVLIIWVYRSVWTSTDLVRFDDLWKIDDAFRLGVTGTRDVLWARGRAAVDRSLGDARTIALIVLGSWALLTSFSQTYFSIAVSRRAGDELPHRSNLVHAARRAPRVLAAWAVVTAGSFALLFGPARLIEDWTLWISVPVQLVLQVAVTFLITRTSFVVAIAVADDDLAPGLGWAQCLVRSWQEVRGRTISLFLRLFAITIVPVGLAVSALHAIAFAEGVTGAGIGLAIATELTVVSVLVTVFVGAASALYVIEYRHD